MNKVAGIQLLTNGNVSWRAIRRARPPSAGPRARLIAASASKPTPSASTTGKLSLFKIFLFVVVFRRILPV
jgi:hypothetical protein